MFTTAVQSTLYSYLSLDQAALKILLSKAIPSYCVSRARNYMWAGAAKNRLINTRFFFVVVTANDHHVMQSGGCK